MVTKDMLILRHTGSHLLISQRLSMQPPMVPPVTKLASAFCQNLTLNTLMEIHLTMEHL